MAGDACWTLIKIKSAKMMYSNITIERLEQIDRERQQTQSDRAYQRWLKELKVGSRYIERTPIHNAREAMSEWDVSRFRCK
jgi:hypothetical protein